MKQLVEKYYKYLPILIQNIIISAYGLKLINERYGRVYKEYYSKFKYKTYTSIEEELNYQNKSLQEFLSYTVKESTFYKNLYKNIDLSGVCSIEDLKKLPIVSKEDLRKNISDIYTVDESKALSSYTGGTTGKALKVLFTKEDFQIRMAYLDAFKAKIGLENYSKLRKATFSGRSFVFRNQSKIFWRYNLAYKQRLYSTFHLNNKNLPYYIKDLNRFKPEVINGFVSAIYELADYIGRNDVNLLFEPKAIFTTSETLLDMHRDRIETVFGCRVYDQYASAEGAPFITECKEGRLHYNMDTGVIELDENNEMIVTSFNTHGTPLIRYNIGDKLTFSKETCSCGSVHPVVEEIKGRKVDFLLSTNSDKISLSHLADVIKGLPNSVIKMQFIQNSKRKLDVNLVIDEDLFSDKDTNSISKELKYRFGSDMELQFHFLKDIPREKSGKYSLIKNNL